MAKLVLRRDLWVQDTSKPPEVAETPIPFSEVKEGQNFYLRPAKYVGITFVKIAPRVAEIYTWDEYAPQQSFPLDTMVYPVIHKLKPRGE